MIAKTTVIADRKVKRRRALGYAFLAFCILALTFALASLFTLLATIISEGAQWLDWGFISHYGSRHPEEAGLKAALAGSIWLMAMTAVFTIPVGVGAALYLEEYAPKNWLTRIIELNIANLAGVPSIVYGLLGLAVFVQWLAMGRSVLAGAFTMTLLVLPVVIITSREAIRTVPNTYREAAYALGATRGLVVRDIVIPLSLPGILTGVILALSRALGEAAPIIAISALVYLTFIPGDPLDRFTVLPIQIFNWVSRPQEEFRGLAAAGIMVLLILLVLMNSIAIYIRNRFQSRPWE
ncbi:MAG: phosphate ABC transporter permease PstA [Dehalococcoidia bacterium]|nr:phosphate ABC transporter permease PstA [Dehalococcoidia bacterium]